MTAIIKKVKCSTKSIKDKCMDFYKKHRYVSGITVIELVLILVIVIALLLILKIN